MNEGDGRRRPAGGGKTYLAAVTRRVDLRRLGFLALGVVLFAAVHLSPPWGEAIDPLGKNVPLTDAGKSAVALVLLAVTWWIADVVPIGVTSIAVGVLQALFGIRPAGAAFRDFMDPSIWFIFGSLVIGMALAKTGLARRIAYKMLPLFGERTGRIYLGCFLMTATLTLVMTHTAVVATVFPLLMAIHALSGEADRPTRFGKGLFMGMTYVAGAASVMTLLGSPRTPLALGLRRAFTGETWTFLGVARFLLPLGLALVLLIWLLMRILFPPEVRTIPGLRERARQLYARSGPFSRAELLASAVVAVTLLALGLKSFVPALARVDDAVLILLSTLLFFVLGILSTKDLEEIPWNIVLLFGGAMSLGSCLWETGAAHWIAARWLILFRHVPPLPVLLALAAAVLVLTNFVMSVAAIAVALPIVLSVAPYLGVNPAAAFLACTAAAGMPFLLVIGTASNAIAFESKQFSRGEFFRAGLLASILFLAMLALFARFVWPWLGLPFLGP